MEWKIAPASEEAIEALHEGLGEYNDKYVRDKADLSLELTDGQGHVIGGVDAFRLGDLVMLDALWVTEAQRGKGFGRRLVEALEAEAKAQGARRVELNTLGFQAPEFYKKLGYQAFGAQEPALGEWGHYFFVKAL